MDFSHLFPDNRENGQTRLEQCQLVMLRMLKIFDFLCTKHNIRYFLIGGSLLGAIRHQGFIPWDDDLDIGMTRQDYEKFLQYAVHELPDDIFFQNPEYDKYYPPNCNVDARLRDKYSSYNHVATRNNKWHEGLQVDIFVYDRAYFPNNFFIITVNKIFKFLNDGKKRTKVLKYISKYFPFPLVYSSNYLKYYSSMKSSVYVKDKEIKNLIKRKFEDMEVFVPREYDSCLKRQYGDYMKLPPPEKRYSNHDVIADPFKPCGHSETLQWNERRVVFSNLNMQKNRIV